MASVPSCTWAHSKQEEDREDRTAGLGRSSTGGGTGGLGSPGQEVPEPPSPRLQEPSHSVKELPPQMEGGTRGVGLLSRSKEAECSGPGVQILGEPSAP